MLTQDDVATVRRLYAVLAAGDLDEAVACFHEDALWRLPGTGALAGVHRGRSAIQALFLRQVPLSGGTFRARLVDLAVGADYIVAVVHATAEHDDRRLDQSVCQLMRVQGGAIIEVRGHYSDEAQLNAFWGTAPARGDA